MSDSLVLLAASVLVSIATVRLTAFLCDRLRFIDPPNTNTRHPGGSAMGGGVAVVLVLTVAVLIADIPHDLAIRVVIPVAGVSLVGLIDDLRAMPPIVKVLGQCVCIAVYLILSDVSWSTWLIAGPLLVLTANAWNVIDVMDGLAGSVGIMCFTGAGLVMWLDGTATASAWLAFLCAGVLLGFLIWNRPPARIILGDAGSIPVGLLFGLLIVEAWSARPEAGATVALTGVIPFFEVVFLIIERSRRRVPFYRSTPDHFALRLRRHGRSPYAILKAVLLYGGAVSVLAALASAVAFQRWVLVPVFGCVLIGSLIAYRHLHRLSPETAP